MATQVMATERSGNTKHRAFQLTLNEVSKYKELKEYLTHYQSLQYYIACEEQAPTTGHLHNHIYVHFKTPIKLDIKKCQGAHIEVCRGSPKQNIAYIEKNGKIIDEIGERPTQGMRTIKELMAMPREECPSNLLRIYDSELEKQRREEEFNRMLSEIAEDKLEGPEVIYFTGEPGMGKTYSAYKYALMKYEKKNIGKISFNEGFADMVNPKAECLVCEEFRPSDLKASKLLELLDKYGASVNVKGGFEYIRPKTIIIASVMNPKYLYNDEEKNEQFMRRITKLIRVEKDCSTILK